MRRLVRHQETLALVYLGCKAAAYFEFVQSESFSAGGAFLIRLYSRRFALIQGPPETAIPEVSSGLYFAADLILGLHRMTSSLLISNFR